ncbi:MAG TPA: AsmA-like C-terminal region-containing protein [Methylomirabilota bacterium]|nr:AsmA-like C-terminal region-containing protein [Methylomirabilota bacterium]
MRRFFLVIIIVTLALLAYVNYIGVPAFVKKRLTAELAEQGFNVQFSDLRVRRFREVALQNFILERPGQNPSPRLTGERAVVSLNPWAIFGDTPFQTISLVSGTLSWPFQAQNEHAPFVVTNISLELAALPERDWSFGIIRARAKGIDVELSAAVKPRKSTGKQMERTRAETEEAWRRWQEQIGQVLEHIQQIEPERGGRLRLSFDGDLDDLASLRTTVNFDVGPASSPWGKWANLDLKARIYAATNLNEFRADATLQSSAFYYLSNSAQNLLFEITSTYPLTTNAPVTASARLSLGEASTEWGRVAGFSAGIESHHVPGSSNLLHTLQLTSQVVDAHQGQITNLNLTLTADQSRPHALSEPHTVTEQTIRSFRSLAKLPYQLNSRTNHASGNLRVSWSGVNTKWVRSGPAMVQARFEPATNAPPASASLAHWNYLRPWQFDVSLEAAAVAHTNAVVDSLKLAGSYKAPYLQLTNIAAELYGKKLESSADVNLLTRRVNARAFLNFDVKRVEGFLSRGARRWLAQYTWDTPPEVRAEVGVTLPRWDEKSPDWEKELLPTLTLAGELSGGPGAFRGAKADHVRTHLAFTNLQWTLPDLTITRPEGVTVVDYWNHVESRDFRWKLAGQLDPTAIKSLLDPPAQDALELFKFSEAPKFAAQIWGRWGEPENTALEADVALTNVAFREQFVRSLKAQVALTNNFLHARNVEVIGEVGHATVPAVHYDIAANRIFLSNGFSTLDPMLVARAVGRVAVRAIEDYVFLSPPTVHVHGWVPADDDAAADVRFQVEGGPFHYWKFNVPSISGRLHWKGDDLAVRDIRGPFYGGSMDFIGDFHFPKETTSADFSFTAHVRGGQLQPFMQDVLGKTNRMEGGVDTLLVVTSANSADMKSWSGYGSAQLTNGFLWDVPVFGFFSPMLDAVSSGLGRSEVKAASMHFMMTNSVLHTRDLVLRSDAFRLHYDGTVDFDANVKARVEAELLRDTFLFGRIFSAVLWPVRKLFEYKVSGTLSEPKSEPVYIPKFLLAPFRARKIISDLEANSIQTRYRKAQAQMREDTERAMKEAEREDREKAERQENAPPR